MTNVILLDNNHTDNDNENVTYFDTQMCYNNVKQTQEMSPTALQTTFINTQKIGNTQFGTSNNYGVQPPQMQQQHSYENIMGSTNTTAAAAAAAGTTALATKQHVMENLNENSNNNNNKDNNKSNVNDNINNMNDNENDVMTGQHDYDGISCANYAKNRSYYTQNMNNDNSKQLDINDIPDAYFGNAGYLPQTLTPIIDQNDV